MEHSKPIIIAIDGFSSCGKSTFAKAIAVRMGYIFIDTGAMYRAIALLALGRGLITTEAIDTQGVIDMLPSINIDFKYNAEREASDIYIDDKLVANDKLRTKAVNQAVSRISSIKEVREKLVALQQAIGEKGGVVMDGRDIGTVVFPSARIKIYMTAEPRIRAQRRYEELSEGGDNTSFEEIEASIIARDNADLTREISPLRRADDAVVLDNSHMSVAEQMEWFVELYNAKVCE